MSRNVLGLDIGGANLKAAHTKGVARTEPFPVWKNPTGLAKAIKRLLGELPAADLLAVTMTAELCDCYESKRAGVNAVLDAVQEATKVAISVWQNDGFFTAIRTARLLWHRTASANWLALATFAGRFCPTKGRALVVDIGSTTTDIVPIVDGKPAPKGRTDMERLRHHELVYMGARRTPVCAVLPNVAAELFATVQDAYVLLGDLPEEPDNQETADGRPLTKRCSHARLARMLCGDAQSVSMKEAVALAKEIREHQCEELRTAVIHGKVPPPQTIILAGSGEFLARAALASPSAAKEWKKAAPEFVSLAKELGPEISTAACAYAVAMLASERFTR